MSSSITNLSVQSSRGNHKARLRRTLLFTSLLLPLLTLGFTCEEEEESALRESLEAISGTCYSPPTITYQNTIRDLAWNYCAECHREDAVQAQEPFFMDDWEIGLLWTDGEVTVNDYIVPLNTGEVNPYTFYYAIAHEYMPMSQAAQPTALEKEYVEAWMTEDVLREDSFYKVLVSDVNMDEDGSVTIGDGNEEYVDDFLTEIGTSCAGCHYEGAEDSDDYDADDVPEFTERAWFKNSDGTFNYSLILSQANNIYQRACGSDPSMNFGQDCTDAAWNDWFTAIAKPFDDAYGSDLGSASIDDLAVRTPGANVLVDITYSASDSDSDYAEVSLWYSDNNQTVSDDNLIVDCLETGGSISGATHTWNSTDVPAGEYYIWACIQDNDNVICSFSDEPVSAGTEIPDGGI
jgi:hypothetical protein